jgi:hypothetical protein
MIMIMTESLHGPERAGDHRESAGNRPDGAGARTARRPDGPNAGILALIAVVLSVASVALPALLAGTGYPEPSDSAATVAAYFTHHAFAATITGLLVFGAAVPIGIHAATTHARMLHLGIRVPGPHIAFFGGMAASVLLSIAGLSTWALGQASAGVPAAVVRLLAGLVFAIGGIGFVGALGLLVAGVAVPALILRLTPRWLAWAGLVLAGLSELSFFGLLWPGFDLLLPVGRFVGLLWLVVVGFLLPRNRRDVPRRAARP